MEHTFNNNPGGSEVKSERNLERALHSLAKSLVLLWRARKKLLIVNTTVLVVSFLILILVGRFQHFQSTITVLPDYGNRPSLSKLSDIASSMSAAGLALGQIAPTEIYENIVFSDAVLEPVIYARYKTEAFKDSVNLIEYFKVKPDNDEPPLRRDLKRYKEFYKSFTKQYLETNVTGLTKILTITVSMPESKLSADVANNIAESLDRYVRIVRKSNASEERFYIEKRIDQVQDSLNGAELALEQFRERNKVVEQSPLLLLQQARLVRSTEILGTVYMELTKQLELTKLDEVKDTPVLNVREKATDPVIRTGPSRFLILIVVMLFSGVGSCVFYLREQEILLSWKGFKGTVAQSISQRTG